MNLFMVFCVLFPCLVFFCLEFFSLLIFVLCLVCPVFPVFVDCPFLITASVFSNIYFQNVRQILRRDMSLIMSILLSVFFFLKASFFRQTIIGKFLFINAIVRLAYTKFQAQNFSMEQIHLQVVTFPVKLICFYYLRNICNENEFFTYSHRIILKNNVCTKIEK